MNRITKYLNEQGTLIKRKRDETGSYSDEATYPESCYVEYGQKRIRNRQGEEVTATAMVYLDNDSNLDPSHETWDFEHHGRRLKVESINLISDPRPGKGLSHYELGVI